MKKIVSIVLCLALVLSLLAGCSGTTTSSTTTTQEEATQETTAATAETAEDDILIGVSIWSSTDTLGSQCKLILDAAADALGVKIMYVDQGHISEQVTASAETLAAAGCDGMIICNSASAEMTSVINTCDEYEMYCAHSSASSTRMPTPTNMRWPASRRTSWAPSMRTKSPTASTWSPSFAKKAAARSPWKAGKRATPRSCSAGKAISRALKNGTPRTRTTRPSCSTRSMAGPPPIPAVQRLKPSSTPIRTSTL